MGRSRTCFSSTVVGSDAFMSLPSTAQVFYVQLAFEADGYGIVSNALKTARGVGASQEDIDSLVDGGFLIRVLDCYVFRHWWINNNHDSSKNQGKPSRPDIMEKIIEVNRLYEPAAGNQPEVRRNSAGKVIESKVIESKVNKHSQGKPGKPGRVPSEIVQRIVDHLNEKAGKHYKPTTSETVKLIGARILEGFTEADFFTVIDNKSAQWKGSDNDEYLRPSTLFSPSKFEGYLNAKPTPKGGAKNELLSEYSNLF